MRRMFEAGVVPRIAMLRPDGPARAEVILRVFGLPESQVSDRLAALGAEDPLASVHDRLAFPEVLVRLVVVRDDAAQAEAAVAALAGEARRRLAPYVHGEGDDTYAAAVGRALRSLAATLALAESCTGGLAGDIVTNTPGSSDYLRLGVVAYSNQAKCQLLGVPAELIAAHGAVSAEVATAMAQGARRLGATTLGIGVSGIAGPAGGSAEKPVGLVHFALAAPDGEVAREIRFPGSREQVKRVAAFAALSLILRYAEAGSVAAMAKGALWR
jgi:nicotinamide-nucleotide amidase